VLFFAPAQIAKRREEWGAEDFDRRVAHAWHDFVALITRARREMAGSDPRIRPDTVEATYLMLLDGKVPAQEGHILTLATA
jgi:hypothetical protein